MFKGTVSGNVGKDAEVKQVGENKLTTFSIASNRKVKGEKKTTWVRCQMWNREKLAPYITKGTGLTVVGDVDIYEGEKSTIVTINVSDLGFHSSVRVQPATASRPEENPDDALDSDLPF